MIHIQHLHYQYPHNNTPSLQNINLDISSAHIHALIGHNAAGKTTLIALIANLLNIQKGSIKINGIKINKQFNNKNVSWVPQTCAFYPMLTVAENLAFFAGAQGIPRSRQKERCAEALAFARLEEVAGRRAGELSGGMQRRLNLAIGLTGAPKVLLLDEPTVGVDPQSRLFLLEAVRNLAAAGCTVVYTSHYMEEVEAVCTDVTIIDHGKVVATGPLAELKRGQTTELTLVPTRPLPQMLAADWRARFPGMTVTDNAIQLPNLAANRLASLLAELDAAEIGVERVAYGTPSLEQVFMRLTRDKGQMPDTH